MSIEGILVSAFVGFVLGFLGEALKEKYKK